MPRNESVPLRQVIHMLVGDTVNEKIRASAESGDLARLLKEGNSDSEIVDQLYLAAVSRRPRPNEKDDCQTVISRSADRLTGLQSVLWRS